MSLQHQQDICRLCLAETDEMFNINDDASDNLTYLELSNQIADLSSPDGELSSNLICDSCRKFCQEVLKFRYMILTSYDCLQKSSLKDKAVINEEEEIEYEIEALHGKTSDTEMIDDDLSEDLIEETIYNTYDDGNENSDDDALMEEIVTKVEKFECPEEDCREVFTSDKGLRRHRITHCHLFIRVGEDESDLHVCIICGSKFESRNEHNEHRKEHKIAMDGGSTINCRFCKKTHSSLRVLLIHLNQHDETKNFLCTLCDKRFSDVGQDIHDHIDFHAGSTHICFCGRTYQSETQLKNHMRRSHPADSKEHLCSECGKSFVKKANLYQHLVRHRAHKQFSCDRCPAKFSSRGNLKAHQLSHVDERPFKCEICGSAFKQNYSLAKHKKVIHSGERNYQCDYCDMRFRTSDHAKRHMRTHTGEKPYQCEFCSKSFSQNGDLNKHKRMHIGENTYKCEEHGCEKTFKYRKDLRNHYLEHTDSSSAR